MTNEIVAVKVVKEVDEVLTVVQKHIELKKSMNYKDLSMLLQKINVIIKDYKTTTQDLLCTSSLAVKLENLISAVGIIGTVSIEDEDILDNTLKLLSDYSDSIMRK